MYPRKAFGGDQCFIRNDGVLFRPFVFPEPKDYALAIEYADNEEAASKNLFEDGDKFYLSDYATAEDMLQDMRREIES